MIFSFLIALLFFVLIGALSAFKKKNTQKDYFVASHNITPLFVALSAVSTNNSGYMFIGHIGLTYFQGLSSIWLMIGWVVGDFIGSLFLYKKLCDITKKNKILSFGGILSKWQGVEYKKLRILIGLITIIFLSAYAGAQFKAGSKALHVLFGWDYSVGSLIACGIVLFYCIAGGMRASIWTDVAQSVVMMGAMMILLVYCIYEAGGLNDFLQAVQGISPTYLFWFPDKEVMNTLWAPFLFVVGWIFSGLATIGQPHVITRFMALDNSKHLNRVRCYYYSWYTLFCLITFGVGIASRVLLPPQGAGFDYELALPILSKLVLPEVLVGIILAGVFSACMSSADAQILCCSSALSKDILPKKMNSYFISKLGTVFIAFLTLLIALYGGKSVLSLILIAWSSLGAAFVPLLLLYSLNVKVSESVAILTMLVSASVTLLWRYLDLNQIIFEMAPGVAVGFLFFYLTHKLGFNRLKTKS